MNSLRLISIFLILTAIYCATGLAQYLYLDSALTISTPTTFDSVRITSTGRLTADDSIAVLGNMVIESGGIVTHAVRDTTGLKLNVVGTLDVQTGGSINVTGKGLRGGYNSGNGSANGESYDANGNIVSGAGGGDNVGAGASYGGIGGNDSHGRTTNAAYGVLENPHQLGSGAGGSYFQSYIGPGGNGGGRVSITAATAIINGSVLANGEDGVSIFCAKSGGGSGGSILIHAGTISGNGSIAANGGVGKYSGENSNCGLMITGSGGGGRIAIFYTTNTFPAANISATGKTDGNPSGPGTIYLKDNGQTNGDVIINNGTFASNVYTPLRTTLTTLKNLYLQNYAQLHVAATDLTSFTIEQQLSLVSTSIFWLGNGVTLSVTNGTGFDVNVESGSTLLLDTSCVLNANALRVNGGTLNAYSNLSFPVGTDLEVSGGAVLNMYNNAVLSVGVFDGTNFMSGTVNITAGSRLDIATNSATIGNGVTLIKDGSFGVNDQIGNLTILSGGIMSHSVRDTTGLKLNVVGTLDVQTGGSIDVTGKGLRGGYNSGNGSINGENYDANGSIIFGVGGGDQVGAGASYGGIGGDDSHGRQTNAVYGVLENPHQLGSGAGGSWFQSFTAAGGNGGGYVSITTATAIINGTILANGGDGVQPNVCWKSGGGSGGSILIHAGNVSGNGSIEAVGGKGKMSGSGSACGLLLSGSGGGGRIAIFYTTNTFLAANISATGMTDGNPSGPGTMLLAKETGNFTQYSRTDPVLILAPAGNIPFEVTIRDSNNVPVVGSSDLWLDFANAQGLTRCPGEFANDQIIAPLPSDASGKIRFFVKGGGCSSDPVRVMTSKGIIAQVPIKSLDHNGGLLVTAGDFVGDACNDYNNDGVTGAEDFDFFFNYLGQTCIEDVANHIKLKIFTYPPPDNIYFGDTINVCVSFTNDLSESVTIDNALFSETGFGIGYGWTPFSSEAGITLPANGITNVCKQYIISSPQHGCFKITASNIHLSPLATQKDNKILRSTSSGTCEVQMNIDPKICVALTLPDPPPGEGDLVNWPCKSTVAAQQLASQADNIETERTLVNPLPTGTTYTATVPIGNQFGDSLHIFKFTYLPKGWSVTVSDSGWIHTPDTLSVTITHDSIVTCGDTARVIFLAYNSSDEFAGNAEVVYHLLGWRGDLNYSTYIGPTDLRLMDSLLFAPNWRMRDSIELGVADLNNDRRIDIADATWLTEFVYGSHTPFECFRDTATYPTQVFMQTNFQNDTTTVVLNSLVDLRGIELELSGPSGNIPINLLGDSIFIATGVQDSVHRIGLFDTLGVKLIHAGSRQIIKIKGHYSLVSARASDLEHHSIPVSFTGLTASMSNGWNMVSVPMLVYGVARSDIFPSATSNAFAYQNTYVVKDTLKHGASYWLKFAADEAIIMVGYPLDHDTMSVTSGWNMVGSISTPIAVSSIIGNPSGLTTSQFFGYDGTTYIIADTIYPFKGYWVRVNQDGTLILSSSVSTPAIAKNAIRIVPTSELPPPPPVETTSNTDALPKEYALDQAYPNPFNPSTIIRYQLPVDSRVTLRIYDVLGQVVGSLVEGMQDAGYMQVEWNASMFSSGVYFYCLEATSTADPSRTFTSVKKMVLVK